MTPCDCMDALMDAFFSLATVLNISAQEMKTPGTYEALKALAFESIAHEPFETLDALSAAHTAEIEAVEAATNARFRAQGVAC